MEEIIRNGAVFGGLLALPLLCWRTRWRHTTVFLGLVLGLAPGLWWEVLGTGWREGGPIRALALLLGWVAFTRLASQAGGPRLRGPSWIVAPLLGALVGDWGAALLLAPIAPSNRVAGRWVLGAMAGALLLPHGTPAVLLIASPASLGWLPAIL